MARKTVGYVHLEWTCPACGNVNKGTDASCRACGAAMPDDMDFELRKGTTLDDSQEAERRASAGPDIVCPYCGTRNPATTTVCERCGGDFADAERMASGKIIGAFSDGEGQLITCPSCGAENPPDANNCSQCGASLAPTREIVSPPDKTSVKAPPPKPRRRSCVIVLGIIAIVAVLISLLVSRCGRQSEISVSVTEMSWTRTVQVEGLVAREAQAWHDQVPADAPVLGCEDRLRSTSEEPVAGAVEVCGTPYVVDTGTGLGQVVQDCVYEIYEPWCTYQTMSWTVVDTISTQGTGLPGAWPQPALSTNQRLGAASENFVIRLRSQEQSYTYTPATREEYESFAPGENYVLTIGGFGQIINIKAE